ncbi:STAS domain-containing protein [Streptosporangium roseum]|uniref:Anti-sigma factor antagonist n=1 Tax=Streptosporangium roseum (strain ATCC 12428 / DSM 43021 / JCM 3005 / KCTC 9067 / NCIMB 10171 / NRRL 2505 / NI 9100) TaxID=479432 RepID=D2BA24_STRRD|nr:STAS domain-containing protein [Streptosporangium roseum]ACZ86037.1 Anti-anti-sigma regulatory factor (antagonist of anti-sigma factor)-like protein [Streptosporangium roseum DSM 43021]
MTSQRQHLPVLAVSATLRDGVSIIHVAGELDLATAPTLRRHLRAATLPSAPPVLIVDVREVSFCDSVGLSELVLALHRSQTGGQRPMLSGQHRSLERPLYRTGLHNAFERHASCDAALRQVGVEAD